MKCKPGQMAMIMKSEAGNEGKVVTCVKLSSEPYLVGLSGKVMAPIWETDTMLASWDGRRHPFVPDSALKPLPGGEGNEAWFKSAPVTQPNQKKVTE